MKVIADLTRFAAPPMAAGISAGEGGISSALPYFSAVARRGLAYTEIKRKFLKSMSGLRQKKSQEDSRWLLPAAKRQGQTEGKELVVLVSQTHSDLYLRAS